MSKNREYEILSNLAPPIIVNVEYFTVNQKDHS